MNYAKTLLFVFSFTIALIFFSCEKGTEPEQLKPGRRDYTWEIDTLKAWNTYLMKMWGSSPTDIWAVGHGCCFEENIWHYDGTKWTTDGIWRGISPWCIYGFAENDIWIGGSDGKIWHYDGSDWSESLAYSEELNYEYLGIIFYDIWGENPNDIYAVGLTVISDKVFMSIMMHYDGTKWSRVNIEPTKGAFYKIRKGSKTSDKYYIHNIIQFPDSVKYFEYDLESFNTIYYDIDNWHELTLIDDEVVFTIDNGIYTYNKKSFNLIAKNPFSNNYQSVYGRNRKDIIWTMADGLTHFNGTDFEYILNFENYQLSDGFIRLKDGFVFEKDVFFVTHGDKNNYIFHGVLK